MDRDRIDGEGAHLHSAVPLTDGTVLVVGQGGRENPPCIGRALRSGSRSEWDTTAKPAHTREGATATMLSNGMVLLVGDYDGDRSAELYDPGSGM